MLSAIILAAGRSIRMGQNKLLLSFQGKTLIVRAADTLLASEVDEVVVVLGHEAEKVRAQLQGKQVRLVHNPDYCDGLSTSVRVGVSAVSPQAEGIMIYLADQPLLEPGDINFMIKAFVLAKDANKSIVVPLFHVQTGTP